MMKEQLGQKLKRKTQQQNKQAFSSKGNKNNRFVLLVSVPQQLKSLTAFPLLLCASTQHSTATTGQLILTLSPPTNMTA